MESVVKLPPIDNPFPSKILVSIERPYALLSTTKHSYLILASDNRIVSAIPADEIKDSKDSLIKFLNYKMLPYKEGEHFVVSFKPRVTKAGKKMASLVVADAGREMHSVVVFPMQFAKAYMKIEEGNVYKFEFGKTKDGTVTMNEVESV